MSEKKPFELKKMWQWLVYLYVVLPALLFLLGFLTRNMDMGILFARLVHSYCLYVVNPIPDVPSMTGIVGAVLALGVVFYTLYRRDFRDFGVSFALIALNFLYYFTQTNYLLIRYLRFM